MPGASGREFCGSEIALPSAMLKATSTFVTERGTLPSRWNGSLLRSDQLSQNPTNCGPLGAGARVAPSAPMPA